jgi:hypothetical protein
MDLVDAGKLLFLAGVAILSCLWLLDKLAPFQSALRLEDPCDDHRALGLRKIFPVNGTTDNTTIEYVWLCP